MKFYLLLSVVAIAFFLTFVEYAECSEAKLENVLELPRQRRQVAGDEDCPEEFVRIGDECITTTDITRRKNGIKILKDMAKKGGKVVAKTAAQALIELAMQQAAKALTTTTPAQ